MAAIVLSNLDEPLAAELERRAAAHRRSTADEAMSILRQALLTARNHGWEGADAIHARLLAARPDFSDSAESIREDRDR